MFLYGCILLQVFYHNRITPHQFASCGSTAAPEDIGSRVSGSSNAPAFCVAPPTPPPHPSPPPSSPLFIGSWFNAVDGKSKSAWCACVCRCPPPPPSCPLPPPVLPSSPLCPLFGPSPLSSFIFPTFAARTSSSSSSIPPPDIAPSVVDKFEGKPSRSICSLICEYVLPVCVCVCVCR